MFDLCFPLPLWPFEAKRVHTQLFGKFLDVNDLRQNISFAVGLFIIIARMLNVIFCWNYAVYCRLFKQIKQNLHKAFTHAICSYYSVFYSTMKKINNLICGETRLQRLPTNHCSWSTNTLFNTELTVFQTKRKGYELWIVCLFVIHRMDCKRPGPRFPITMHRCSYDYSCEGSFDAPLKMSERFPNLGVTWTCVRCSNDDRSLVPVF